MSSTLPSSSSGQVRFFCYSQFHGKLEPVGSDYIRAHQLIKHWPEAGLYKYGEFPDCLIFNKVFVSQDYQFPKHFENKKILDICDPMWLEGHNIVETCQAMDAVTCPTVTLADYIRQFHTNVVVVPDRFDLDVIPKPKVHKGKAKTVVWFGYSHNAELLKPAIPIIESLGLNLLIISNDDPIANRWGIRDKKEWYTYKPYNEATIYQDLQKADFAILPDGFRPEDKFKSNNKTIKANLAGLPVAKTREDVELYMSGEARQDWFGTNYAIIAKEYDVKNSVKQMQELIKSL
jgi:hypothetical protein